MAQRSADEPELVRKSTEAIITSVRRMNTMIEDLVDIARLEVGQLRLEARPVDLRSLLSELLERIFTNLLSNALKYSPVETQVLVTAGKNDGEALISVSDRGIGIAPEDIPNLFKRY